MTTTTAPKTDPLDDLRKAQVGLDAERAERARLGERRDQYANKIREAQAELGRSLAPLPVSSATRARRSKEPAR